MDDALRVLRLARARFSRDENALILPIRNHGPIGCIGDSKDVRRLVAFLPFRRVPACTTFMAGSTASAASVPLHNGGRVNRDRSVGI